MTKRLLIVCALLILLTSTIIAVDIKLQYKNGDYGNATDNHIKPHLMVVNNDTESVDLSEIKIRYYYSKEGSGNETFHVDYAYIGGNNVTGTFYNDYLEIGFTSDAGSIAGFSDSGEIQIRFNKEDWSNYDETNDYSYNNSATMYDDSDKITLYLNDSLICGMEPGDNIPTLETSPIPESLTEPKKNPEPGLPFIESGGMVVIEAEHFSTTTPGSGAAAKSFWKKFTSRINASNGTVLAALPNKNIDVGDTTDGPGLVYDVQFSETGTYYFWVRMVGLGGANNSLHGGLDGTPASFGKEGISITSRAWKWVNRANGLVTVDVETAGLHTVNIWMREDGIIIDKILLTTDPDFVPKWKGPPESQQGISPTLVPTPVPTPTVTDKEYPDAGLVWIQPNYKVVTQGDDFSVELHLNSGNQLFAAYGIKIAFNPTILTVHTSTMNDGIEEGTDGFITAISPPNPGFLFISGFDLIGTGPGEDLHVLTIHFTALSPGETDLAIIIDILADLEGNSIGHPTSNDGRVIVEANIPAGTPTSTATPTPEEPTDGPDPTVTPPPSGVGIGDVNNDGRIDIVDALLCAQYYVGLNVQYFDATGGDVNSDGTINIIDALLIAQYYVGLIINLPGPDPTPEGEPTPIPAEGAGDVWISPETIEVAPGEAFKTEVHVNTGTQGLAAFALEITYDPSLISFDTNIGIENGNNGLGPIIDNIPSPGTLIISGFDPEGIMATTDAFILEISWIATTPGTGTINIIVNDLVDHETAVIGIPNGIGASISVIEPGSNSKAGDVSIIPAAQTVNLGDDFTTEIHVNTGDQKLAAYGIDLSYNSNIIQASDIEAGADGFVSATSSSVSGLVILSGFDVTGAGPGNAIHLITVTWETVGSGTSPLELEVKSLVAPNYSTIGTPRGIGGIVTVTGTITPAVTGTPTPTPSPTPIPGPTDIPPPGVGDVYFVLDTITVDEGEHFTTEIHINSGNQKVAAYGFFISFDNDVVQVDIELGKKGVIEGPYGYIVDVMSKPGQLNIAGFDNQGTGPGTDLHFLTIHWVGAAPGTTSIELFIDNLITSTYDVIGTPVGRNGEVTVIATTPTPEPEPTLAPTTVPEPIEGAGDVWVSPSSLSVDPGDLFTTEIHVNSGYQTISSYSFQISFDPSVIDINQSIGIDGVVKSDEGFMTSVNLKRPGLLFISGVDYGVGPSEDLHLVTIHWKAIESGTSPIDLLINNITDGKHNDIGTPHDIDGSVFVTGTPPNDAGLVWFSPVNETIGLGEGGNIELHINSGNQDIGAYAFELYFNEEILEIDTSIGNNGVEAGADGFVIAVNPNHPNFIHINGFDAFGIGPGKDLHMATVYFNGINYGESALTLKILNLIDTHLNDVGIPHSGTGSMQVIDLDPTPLPSDPGLVSFVPDEVSTEVGENVELDIYVDSGNQKIGAYAFDIYYDNDILQVNRSYGNNGVEPGVDGFFTSTNPDNPGLLKFNGFDVSGKGPGSKLHLVTVSFTAIAEGASPLTLDILDLIDLGYADIGSPHALNGMITVNTVLTNDIGKVWIEPSNQTIHINSATTTELHINTGNNRLAAYGIDIAYDSSILEVDYSIGLNGAEAGPDGFVAAVGSHPGLLRTSGFDISGTGPGPDLHFLTIHWIGIGPGTSQLTMEILDLTNEAYQTIGNPEVDNGTITVVGK